ncbi:transcriptional regulator family: Fungal Specific TF [Penicillium lagena]|uniref:transcriptional regulator family: Fungal Specific TF n=1 Tax=Penicillium lagena TaxID=94218 RepID=UPI0025425428|nr:transcriptional regulator family: Fungal Specific TF [Penicillium lagena]KAJ5613209.1 transcriptional regulator family: Fungal Specific TF [Penicillium lagena]
MATLFSHGESNWYYFDEAWFRDRIMQIYDSDLPETVADCSFTCLAFAAFALSSQFMHIWPNFQGSIGVSGEADLADEGFPGMTYFQNAQRLMPSLLSTCSLESLQSCLLTALYVLPAHSTKMAYTYLGLAMRIGIALGLHSKTADVLSPVIVENNCRVFWTTYSIERRLSISLGYPEMLQEREISCPLPQRRNDLDAPDSLKVERLIAHTKLLLLFNEVIQVSIRERLLLWKEDLPPALQAFDQDCLRANVHLQLQYHIVWVCLGRAALLQLVRRSIMSKETETNKNPVESTPLGLDLTYPCVRSAYEIIDLIGLLRRYQQLARFSHTDFRTCCCATIIVILDSILYPTVRASSKAAEAFDALQYMTFGNEHARSSLKYIESFLEIVNSALAKFHCRQPLQSTFHRSSEVRGFDSCSTSDEKNNRRDDHENSSPMAGSNLETMQEWRSEGGNPCQRAVADFDGLEFGLDNIEALLNDCPPMDLHFLGLGDFHM